MHAHKTDCDKTAFTASQGKQAVHGLRGLSWRLFERKFMQHYPRYFSQCTLATLTILIVLLALDSVTQTVLISALGASTFIAFTMPLTRSSGPRYLVGGYIVGTVVGVSIALLGSGVVPGDLPAGTEKIILAALATGLAILIMVVTDTEHPPAAALAMGYVLNAWTPLTVAVVVSGIIFISTYKELIKKQMIDLL